MKITEEAIERAKKMLEEKKYNKKITTKSAAIQLRQQIKDLMNEGHTIKDIIEILSELFDGEKFTYRHINDAINYKEPTNSPKKRVTISTKSTKKDNGESLVADKQQMTTRDPLSGTDLQSSEEMEAEAQKTVEIESDTTNFQSSEELEQKRQKSLQNNVLNFIPGIRRSHGNQLSRT